MFYRALGVHKDYFDKVDSKNADRQIWVYNLLSLMIIILGLMAGFSFAIYAILIFQNLFIAIICGLALSLIVWNILNLIVLLSIIPRYTHLYELWTNMEQLKVDFYNKDLRDLTEEKIQEIIYEKKEELRTLQDVKLRDISSISYFTKNLIKVTILVVLAIIIANGIELFMFSDQINLVINEMRTSKNIDSWTLENILTVDENNPFILLESNSILFDLKILNSGLNFLKLPVDLIFIALYLLPLIIVLKSKETTEGEYAKELALSDITTTFYFYLLSQKKCQLELENIERRWDEKLENLPKQVANNKSLR
jgi:hypothetical protein